MNLGISVFAKKHLSPARAIPKEKNVRKKKRPKEKPPKEIPLKEKPPKGNKKTAPG